jgi:opacity protein-like surface antigen
MKSRACSLPVTLLVAAMFATPGLAADAPRADVSAGYSYLDSEIGGFNGWQASLGWNLWGRLGLVADVSGHYRSEQGVDLDDLAFMGGLRFALHGRSVTPFAYGLAGGVRASGSVSVFEVTISESSTELAWAVGGGLDLRLSERWALRAQADYLRIEAEPAEGNPRAGVGVVYRIGR